MKATQETSFKPIILILETQKEVDAIYTLLNHVKLSKAVGLNGDEYKVLIAYTTNRYEPIGHHELCNLLK